MICVRNTSVTLSGTCPGLCRKVGVMEFGLYQQMWFGGVTLSALGLNGHGFDFQLGHHRVVTAWMGDCLQTGKLSRYITNIKVNSAFHPSGVGKSSTSLSGWG